MSKRKSFIGKAEARIFRAAKAAAGLAASAAAQSVMKSMMTSFDGKKAGKGKKRTPRLAKSRKKRI